MNPNQADNSHASIIEMAQGAIIERVDYEMVKIIDNIRDENTDPKKPRKLVVELTLTPSFDRDTITVSTVVKSKLEPTASMQMSLSAYMTHNGQPEFVENTAQIPGQQDLFGGEQAKPKVLRLFPAAQTA